MENLFFAHLGLAYLSLGLLLTRGVLSAKRGDWRQFTLLKIAPHLVDTLLLASGAAIFFYFDVALQSWVFLKLLFLVLYVLFAAKAFKKNQPFSLKFFLLAVVSFMATMAVATLN